MEDNKGIDEKDFSSNRKGSSHKDTLDFILWKTELNSELLSFWKSMTECNQD